ncbi:MAG: hypothetical protein LBR17_04225 [Bacteroidales bacterium]|nr:hypothetical protein [Bacteroidales bacterium]
MNYSPWSVILFSQGGVTTLSYSVWETPKPAYKTLFLSSKTSLSLFRKLQTRFRFDET